jgi:hypothetical protein
MGWLYDDPVGLLAIAMTVTACTPKNVVDM